MKTTRTTILALAVIGMLLSMNAFAQEVGDYRSAATGLWSEASIWETFDGTEWDSAATAPDGSEHITITGSDSVFIDVAVNITGYVKVEEEGILGDSTGTLTFADGSTYEQARNGGWVPTATWESGSTFLITGSISSAPDNRNQSYHHLIFDTDSLISNLNMALDEVTIGGNVSVISTGSARWYLTSASAGDTTTVTILGDVIVEAGQFAVQGTGNALTGFYVHHYGNIDVSGGNFSIARGSQGNGSGSTVWYLHEGNFTMADATTQNSNSIGAKFVFAKADTQQISFVNVNYAGGRINFDVADTSILEITEDLVINGDLVNRGEIVPNGMLTIGDNGVYEHARNGGTIPTAIWEEGSTALITGTVGDAPANRGQDYHHLTLNTPDLNANRDLSLDGNTISGDIRVISTGLARWQLVGGSSGTITIMGDVIVEDGQFAPQGTGSATEVEIMHYGDVIVTGGNFAISRGSQGGVGTTRWYLLEGDFSMSNATTQNSNSAGATFVFAKDSIQLLALTDVTYAGGGLPVEIADGSILDMGSFAIEGNGRFNINAGGTLASGHPDGIDGNLLTTGAIELSDSAGFMFNGAEAQVPGSLLPDSIGALIVANPEGVSFNDTLYAIALTVSPESVMLIDTAGVVSTIGGTVDGTIVNKGMFSVLDSLEFGAEAVYEHAQNGGTIPSGVWNEGSTFLITGVVGNAPANGNQDFYHIVWDSPEQTSNLNLGWNGNTIGGNITVLNTGVGRWQMAAPAAGDTSIITLLGDIIQSDGQFSSNGTGNALTVIEIHQHGNVMVTGGNFSVSRGSQGSGSGSTRWYLYEGDFSMSDATTQNSNQTNAWFVFGKEGTQTVELGEGNNIMSLPIEIIEGTTVDFGVSEVAGNGLFTLNAGATLATAHADGVAGTVQSTGTVTLDEAANYTFNGTAAQVTSALLPAVVNDLTIDNESGVTHSQETTINGILRLVLGEFDNTIPFTLGPEGTIVTEGGTLRIPVSVADGPDGIPTEFALLQNYPNPFNPSTTIRYDVPQRTHVTVKVYDVMGRQIAELVNGEHDPGAYTIVWDAQTVSSGAYFYRITAGDFTSVRKLVLMK